MVSWIAGRGNVTRLQSHQSFIQALPLTKPRWLDIHHRLGMMTNRLMLFRHHVEIIETPAFSCSGTISQPIERTPFTNGRAN